MTAEPQRYRELEHAIDAIVESYDSALDINNLETAALPNRRAVIEAFTHLLPVLYMGFYSTHPLTRDSLRHRIAEHLYAAHTALVANITRAMNYNRWIARKSECPPSCTPEDVALSLFASIPELRILLDADVRTAYEGDPAAGSLEEVVFSYPSILAITAYRVAHQLYLAHVPMIPRIITEYAHSETGIDIHPGATIGERFFIDHGTGVVIGESAHIGNNVKLYQGVTLGALSIPRRNAPKQKRHPTIEDDVTIYSGATILGGDTVIGRGSVIGGNAWLVSSVPPNTRLLGRSKNGA
jgi:serine O-acetyltransferase